MNFVTNLLNRIRRPPYAKAYASAIRRTAAFSLPVPDVATIQTCFLTAEGIQRVIEAIGPIIQPFARRPELLTRQCFALHHHLADAVSNAINAPAIMTLGNVSGSEGWYYRSHPRALKRLMRTGVTPGDTLHLHAWLTLPSYEILDFTLATTIGYLTESPEMYGDLIQGQPDRFNGGLYYQPLLIGPDFLHRIGAIANLQPLGVTS